jgi:TolA-binding protein
VLDLYLDGNKAPTALLKMSCALLSPNHEQENIRQLKTVMEQYPQTWEVN